MSLFRVHYSKSYKSKVASLQEDRDQIMEYASSQRLKYLQFEAIFDRLESLAMLCSSTADRVADSLVADPELPPVDPVDQPRRDRADRIMTMIDRLLIASVSAAQELESVNQFAAELTGIATRKAEDFGDRQKSIPEPLDLDDHIARLLKYGNNDPVDDHLGDRSVAVAVRNGGVIARSTIRTIE